MRLRILVALALLAPLICAGAPPDKATYRGEYFYNFENAYFTVAGSQECWALKGDMSKAELPSLDGSSPWGTATVVLRGVPGPRGRFGSLGSCPHVFTVLEIIEISNMKRRE